MNVGLRRGWLSAWCRNAARDRRRRSMGTGAEPAAAAEGGGVAEASLPVPSSLQLPVRKSLPFNVEQQIVARFTKAKDRRSHEAVMDVLRNPTIKAGEERSIYESLVNSYCKDRDLVRAYEALKEMQERCGIEELSARDFRPLLRQAAYSRPPLLDGGHWLLGEMKSRGILGDNESSLSPEESKDLYLTLMVMYGGTVAYPETRAGIGGVGKAMENVELMWGKLLASTAGACGDGKPCHQAWIHRAMSMARCVHGESPSISSDDARASRDAYDRAKEALFMAGENWQSSASFCVREFKRALVAVLCAGARLGEARDTATSLMTFCSRHNVLPEAVHYHHVLSHLGVWNFGTDYVHRVGFPALSTRYPAELWTVQEVVTAAMLDAGHPFTQTTSTLQLRIIHAMTRSFVLQEEPGTRPGGQTVVGETLQSALHSSLEQASTAGVSLGDQALHLLFWIHLRAKPYPRLGQALDALDQLSEDMPPHENMVTQVWCRARSCTAVGSAERRRAEEWRSQIHGEYIPQMRTPPSRGGPTHLVSYDLEGVTRAVRMGQWPLAWHILQNVRKHSPHKYVPFTTYSGIFKCFRWAGPGMLDRRQHGDQTYAALKWLVKDMLVMGHAPDVSILNRGLLALRRESSTRGVSGIYGTDERRQKLLEEALEFFEELTGASTGIVPNHMTYTTLIAICGACRDVDKLMDIMTSMAKDPSTRPDKAVFSALIRVVYLVSGPEAAESVLIEMTNDGVWPTLEIVNALVLGALDRGSFTSAISACQHLFNQYGVRPHAHHFLRLMESVLEEGDIHEARRALSVAKLLWPPASTHSPPLEYWPDV